MLRADLQWQMIGAKVPAKERVGFASGLVGNDVHTPHITQVALGPDPKPGRHTVFIESDSEKFAVGTLEKDRCEQFQVDLVGDMLFSHTGRSDIYLSGYNSISPFEESVEISQEDSDDDQAPTAVPLRQQNLMGSKAALAKQQALLAADDESDDDDDDDDDEDGDEYEEDDSEDKAARGQQGIASLKRTLAGAPLNGMTFDMREDDDESEEDSDEEEDDDDEDDSEADGVAALLQAGAEDDDSDDEDDIDALEDDSDEDDEVAVPKGKGKRAAAAAAATPQPQKKAKMVPAKAPASAPPASARSQAATQAGPAQSQWEQDLKAYLKQSGGEAQLSLLGSVKKPESLPKSTKLKAFLQAHPASFTVQGDKVVLK